MEHKPFKVKFSTNEKIKEVELNEIAVPAEKIGYTVLHSRKDEMGIFYFHGKYREPGKMRQDWDCEGANNYRDYEILTVEEAIERLNSFTVQPAIEPGKWYKLKTGHKCIIFLKGIVHDKLQGDFYNCDKGIDKEYYHIGSLNLCYKDNIERLATEDEIKEVLLAYAKRYYPAETKFRSIGGSNTEYKSSGNFYFNNHPNQKLLLFDEESYSAIYNGTTNQWAKILPKEEIKVGDYVAKFTDNTVSFGCKTFTKEQVEEIDEFMRKYNCNLSIEGNTIPHHVVRLIMKEMGI